MISHFASSGSEFEVEEPLVEFLNELAFDAGLETFVRGVTECQMALLEVPSASVPDLESLLRAVFDEGTIVAFAERHGSEARFGGVSGLRELLVEDAQRVLALVVEARDTHQPVFIALADS